MGNSCTIGSKIKPKAIVSEQSYRVENEPKTPIIRFADKDVFHSHPVMAFSVESLERRGKELMMSKMMERHLDQDEAFIREFSKRLMVAKEAMDDSIYHDMNPSAKWYSIRPFIDTGE